MKSLKPAAAYRSLRAQGVWKLLAADTAPSILALLQTLLYEGEKSLSSSVLHERLRHELQALNANGESLPEGPQIHLNKWLAEGWVSRRFPVGASEEVYELTAEAVSALRFAASLLQPRTNATESRLATVIQQLSRLAKETDANPETRLAVLEAEKARIELEIAQVQQGHVATLPEDRALERTREIIGLADELTGDFRRVRDQFDQLNRNLRQSIVEHDGGRGEVLEALFNGIDLIGESEAGRTFNAFWRLLTDPVQSTSLEAALNDVISRPFARELNSQERRFLLQITKRLMEEGSGVHEVLQSFAKSLKSFVQSREYLENRRLHDLLKEAQKAALLVKEKVRLGSSIDYSLFLTSSRIRSVSQWSPYDPSEHVTEGEMEAGMESEWSLDQVQALIRQSEIDFRSLKAHLVEALRNRSQVTLGELLERFPAEQGLGSVLGYISLGPQYGVFQPTTETVSWVGGDGVTRRAHVPTVYFLREKFNDFAA